LIVFFIERTSGDEYPNAHMQALFKGKSITRERTLVGMSNKLY
ncbi:MAG: hypothetical protein RL447_912, partial [Bacteroidota bacterium]